MNINPTTNLNFNAKAKAEIIKRATRFRVPGKNGTTVIADIVDIPSKTIITNLEYKIMKKGKVLEEKAFQNKKGFKDERLCIICENIQKKVKEGFDFLDELFRAQI